jgi:hypothetical protein
MVFEGTITGVGTVDIICNWSGSEAGIAAVAGQGISQPDTAGISGSAAGNFALPGVPPSFLIGPIDGGNWTTSAPLTADNGGRGITSPDLSMADTSQAVSLTPQGTYHLHDYGAVAVIPFTFMEGYNASLTIPNLTQQQANQLITGEQPASFLTGNAADGSTEVVLDGRNKGSGTRVNELLTIQHGVSTAVDQWAFNVSYVANVLTFGASYASGQTAQDVGNDGFDSGGNVAKELEVNESGATDGSSPLVMLGFMGIPDSITAHAGTSGTGSGAATYLPYNGAYESDQGVIQGTYGIWGTEHELGSVGQTGTPLTVGNKLFSGIQTYAAANYGTATGAVGPTYTAQSLLIPLTLMQVSRGGADSGAPTWVGAGNF